MEAGETIAISRAGAAIAKLAPLPAKGTRQFGAMRGKIAIGSEFFETLLPRAEWPLA